MDTDWEKVLHYTIFIGIFLVLLPILSGIIYYMLLLHQAYKNQERYEALQRRRNKRGQRLKQLEMAKRLADPFFHFNVKSAESVDDIVAAQLLRERGHTKETSHRDMKIMRAIEQGKLVLLDTPIEDCVAGMVIGRTMKAHGITRGDEISYEKIQELYENGVENLPVLYNPSRLAGAISSGGRAA